MPSRYVESKEELQSMEARLKTTALLWLLAWASGISPVMATDARTANFIVRAPNDQLAAEIAQAAERCRRDLAIEWLGAPLPDWPQPIPVVATIAPGLGASGRTSFMFNGRTPFGWAMEVQGSRERVLDSVIPHEVTHTIFATHFGCPLPRWADEGACTTVEHASERRKQELWLVRFLKTERGIPFNHMFAMTEYPGDILPLYSQGYSVARYLIAQGGKPKFVAFVGDGLHSNDWAAAVRRHYGYDSLGQMQLAWVDWVIKGSRDDRAIAPVQLASARQPGDASAAIGEAAEPRGQRPLIDEQLASNDVSLQSVAEARPAEDSTVAQSWYARRQTASASGDPVPPVRPTRAAASHAGWRSVGGPAPVSNRAPPTKRDGDGGFEVRKPKAGEVEEHRRGKT
jgi:hypothetical protein